MFKVYVVFLVISTGYLSVKYFSVCLGHFVCVCVCACVRACVRAYVCVWARTSVKGCVFFVYTVILHPDVLPPHESKMVLVTD